MTLFDGSVAGSTVDVNSVIGGEQAAVANKTVAEWISSAERTGHARQDVMPEHVADVSTNADTLQHSEPSIISQGQDDYDSDDEQAEFAKAAFEAGSCAFDKQDWPSATGYLMISKKAFMGLPVNHRDTRTLFELQHKVAMCSYHLGSIDDAESELQGLLQLEPESDEQRIQQCNMNHMLAEIYVRQNKLDAAKAVCKQTSQARSRLLGKQHTSRLESIALLSRICELLGEEVHAKVYFSMIPDDQRDRLIAAASALQPSDVDKVALSTPMETSVLSIGAVEVPEDFPGSSTDCTTSGASDPQRRQKGSDSTTRAARALSIRGPTPGGHDPPSEEAEHSDSTREKSVLADTLRDGPREHVRSPQHEEARKATVGPKADSKGPRVSTPEQTERVGVVGSPNQEPRATSAWTALWEAIASDDADAVRALFQSRPFAARRVLTQQNPRGRTPLYYAVTRAANNERLPLDIVHILLDHGADLDRPAGKSRDNLYTTARKRAMASDREDLVALVRNQALKIALRKSGW
jgi:hypothetical protein